MRGDPRRSRVLFVVLLVATVAVGLAVVPGMAVTGVSDVIARLDLGAQSPPPGARSTPAISEGDSGYVVDGRSSGVVSVPIRVSNPPDDRRVILLVTAPSTPGTDTSVSVASGGQRRSLGTVDGWTDEPLDITREVVSGSPRLRFRVASERAEPVLFLDRILTLSVTDDAESSAAPWSVGLFLGLLCACLLALRGRVTRHWPLVALVGIGGLLLWDEVRDQGLTPVPPAAESLWQVVTSSPIVDLHSGILSGASDVHSSLALQLFQLLEPFLGSGDAAVRGASAVVGVAALALFYAVGARVAGRAGAITAVLAALATDVFRNASATGESTTTLLAASAVLIVAIHVCLPGTRRLEAGLLGAAGAVAILADPVWMPGVLIAILFFPLLNGPSSEADSGDSVVDRTSRALPDRLRVIGTGLLVLVVLLVPNRLSLADQSNGDVLADVHKRATYARNVEFVGQQDDHGAPSEEAFSEDPYGGDETGLVEYIFYDHSLSVVVGGVLTGTNDLLESIAERPESGLAGLVALVVCALGGLYLLILPRLRLLLIIPFVVAAPSLFFASRGAEAPFDAGAPVWVGLLIAAGVLAYAVVGLVTRYAPGPPTGLRRGSPRRSSVLRRRRRSEEFEVRH